VLLHAEWYTCLQCFDTVGWVAGRHLACKKTEWRDAGIVICLGQDVDFAYGLADTTGTHYLLLQ